MLFSPLLTPHKSSAVALSRRRQAMRVRVYLTRTPTMQANCTAVLPQPDQKKELGREPPWTGLVRRFGFYGPIRPLAVAGICARLWADEHSSPLVFIAILAARRGGGN